MSDVRAYVADPKFVSDAPVARLLDRGYATQRARSIDLKRAQTPKPGEILAKSGTDTSYCAVIDAEGNAVSLLQSVFHVFGAADVVPGTGVLMNNRMTGFSLDPASPNVLEPGKRTLHTLNPTRALPRSSRTGKAVMCLGTPGGPSQTYTNAQLLIRTIDRGDDPQIAIDAPRWFVTPAGDLQIESSVPAGSPRRARGARSQGDRDTAAQRGDGRCRNPANQPLGRTRSGGRSAPRVLRARL